MIFGGKKKKDWEDEYDHYYTQQDPDYDRRVKPLLWVHAGILATLGGVFIAIVGAVSGFSMIEKVLKELVTPVGMTWVMLALLTYFGLVYRVGWTAMAAFSCWLLLTIGGNSFVSGFLASNLEQNYLDTNPYTCEPFDVLIVLGGGTNMTPTGAAQLSSGGDRVMVAARMFHSGQTKTIVATGRQEFRIDETDRHPHEETVEILQALSIPQKHLRMLGGKNTSEEMQEIAKWLSSEPESKNWRIGILSSAWHLPRAMALAEANEIVAEGVPANYLTQPYAPNPSVIVPSAHNLKVTGTMLHEQLGRLIGR